MLKGGWDQHILGVAHEPHSVWSLRFLRQMPQQRLCIRYSKHHNHTPLHIYVLAHMQAMVVVLWHSLTWLSAMLPSVGPLGPSLSPTTREVNYFDLGGD